jgi:hypothetical protein
LLYLRRCGTKIANNATIKIREKTFEFLLAVKSDRKIKLVDRQFAAPHVQGLWQAMDKEIEVFA